MMMTNEKRSEIIKALANGYEPVKIAEFENVNISDVQNISVDYAKEIAECKDIQHKKGGN